MSALVVMIVFVTKQKYKLATAVLVMFLVIANFCDAQQTAQSQSPNESPALHLQNTLGNQEESQKPPETGKPEISELTFAGRFHLITGTQRGVLILKAEIPEGSHIYALSQKGSPPPSKIVVTKSNHFQIEGKFSADRNPKIVEFDPIFQGRLEKHYKLVQFYVPIQLTTGIDPAGIHPEIVFDGQVCSDLGVCMPIRGRKIKAVFAGFYDEQAQKHTNSRNRRR